jgi:hypothetical protein
MASEVAVVEAGGGGPTRGIGPKPNERASLYSLYSCFSINSLLSIISITFWAAQGSAAMVTVQHQEIYLDTYLGSDSELKNTNGSGTAKCWEMSGMLHINYYCGVTPKTQTSNVPLPNVPSPRHSEHPDPL